MGSRMWIREDPDEQVVPLSALDTDRRNAEAKSIFYYTSLHDLNCPTKKCVPNILHEQLSKIYYPIKPTKQSNRT
jgi:hypothetical protein